MSKIAKIIDQFGWAYYFLDKEQQKYSAHELLIQRHNEAKWDGLDAIYIHGPDISPEARNLCLEAKERGIKVIGGHAGPTANMPVYPHIDLAVGISPQTFDFCIEHYDCPTVFLPEGIDTEFFRPIKRQPPVPTWVNGKWRVAGDKMPLPAFTKRNNRYVPSITVGWAGRKCEIKRLHLLDQLDFKVEIQSQHGPQFFIEKSHDHMLQFYNHIDVLVMTSLSECMPRVVMEACACGIPVVCTDVGSVRMILDPDWIVPANPEKAVVEEMNKKLHQLENKDVRQKTGLDNRKRVEKSLSWKVVGPFWDAAFTAAIEEDVDAIDEINEHFAVGERT